MEESPGFSLASERDKKVAKLLVVILLPDPKQCASSGCTESKDASSDDLLAEGGGECSSYFALEYINSYVHLQFPLSNGLIVLKLSYVGNTNNPSRKLIN